jgi:hypothetical protein
MRSFFEANFPQTGTRGAAAPQFQEERPTVAVLVANTRQAVAIPAGAKYVVFASEDGAPFWVWYGDANTTLAIPGATTSADTGEPNPISRAIPSNATHLLLLSLQATRVAMTFYSGG